MQLNPPGRPKSIRGRLNTAACLLLASGIPGMAQAADPAPSLAPTTTLDLTGLWYTERITVIEPTARITRIYPDGRSLWGQMVIDAISGASPRGALPSGQTQTITGPSGTTSTRSANEIPMNSFSDTRVAFDGEWLQPFSSIKSTVGSHLSREKDYQSIGANEKLAFDFNQHLTTLTVGAGFNQDEVFPVGGTRAGLSDPAITSRGTNSKSVASGLLGLSHVITRRWMLGVIASFTAERGYLTDPYKVLSVVDPTDGLPVGELSEKRPSTRDRMAVLADSVYHFQEDVLYLTYRYYWDHWDVRSHTLDMKYRHEVGRGVYFQPHVRLYNQSAASFFRSDLVQGAPLPDFASSDYRLGPLTTATVGASLGFPVHGYPGEWTIRAEYIGQFGKSHPDDAVGLERQFDLYPAVNIFSLVVGYSYEF